VGRPHYPAALLAEARYYWGGEGSISQAPTSYKAATDLCRSTLWAARETTPLGSILSAFRATASFRITALRPRPR